MLPVDNMSKGSKQPNNPLVPSNLLQSFPGGVNIEHLFLNQQSASHLPDCLTSSVTCLSSFQEFTALDRRVGLILLKVSCPQALLLPTFYIFVC